MWPPRSDAARTSTSDDSMGVHGWALILDPPAWHANWASGLHIAAQLTGFCISTTATRPPSRVISTIQVSARGHCGINDNPYVLIAASNCSLPPMLSGLTSVASASMRRTLLHPQMRTRRRAWSSIFALISMPVIDPDGPIRRCRCGKFSPCRTRYQGHHHLPSEQADQSRRPAPPGRPATRRKSRRRSGPRTYIGPIVSSAIRCWRNVFSMATPRPVREMTIGSDHLNSGTIATNAQPRYCHKA